MKLNKWTVQLSDYPDYPSLCPFKDWTASNPTTSLPWYDTYNAVKHDREGAFEKATLDNLINAAAALHIMQCAQWRPDRLRHTIFDTVSWPVFEISDHYTSPLKEHNWTEKAYF